MGDYHDGRINPAPPHEDHYTMLGLKRPASWDGGRVDYSALDAYDPNDPNHGVEGLYWQSLLSYLFEAFRLLDEKDELGFDNNEFEQVKERLKSDYRAASFSDVCAVVNAVRRQTLDRLTRDLVRSMADKKVEEYGIASLTVDNL